MPDKDELLQQQLDALENGTPLEKVLSELPEDASELVPLIRLASTVRGLEHPEPQLKASHAGQQHILAAVPSIVHPNGRSHRIRWNWPQVALASGLVTSLAVLLVVLISLVGLGIWLSGPSNARAATVMNISGQVEVASSNTASDWRPVSDGDLVHVGQRIRTGANSGATLVFFEGSRSTLEANTDLTLTTVQGNWGKVLNVELTQQSGKTDHSVVPLRGKQSAFLVRTPSGTASVHGTVFSVAVDQRGQARFSVSRGSVLVSNDQSQVTLAAGQATYSVQGQMPETPSYQFTLQGAVESIKDDTWVVASVPFSVTAQTTISGTFGVGDMVLVEGRTLEDGHRQADTIQPAPTPVEEPQSSFTSEVKHMGSDSWEFKDDVTVSIDENTEIDDGILVGDPVRVTFITQEDGSWLALKIESLKEEEPPSPEPTETEVVPSDTITPTGTITETATPVTDCTGANPHPESLRLAQRYDVTPEEIMGWFCQGYGFGEIDHAYSLSQESGLSVNDIFAMRQSGLGWGQIKQQIKRMTITPTTEVTPTETTPAPETTEPPVEETPPPVTDCTGANPHPEGQRLAQRYGVSPEEIMGWFCKGFGFGEIDHAYSLSNSTGTPVADIFSMRSSGMGWGQIEQQLGDKGKPKNKP